MNFIDRITFRQIGPLRYGVRDIGASDATPIFLLHGLLDTGASFAALVDAIEARRPGRYHFIAPDWRGHGATESLADTYWFPEYLRDLERLIDDAVRDRNRPVVLIGHSMGGQATSLYAGARPRRVSHLITLDSLNVPDADHAKTPRRYRRWLDAQASPPGARVYDSVEAIAERIGTRYPELDSGRISELAEQWSAPVGDHGRHRMRHDPWHRIAGPYAFRAAEAMALWREVTARVLCVDAADSPMRHIVDADEMTRRRACFADLRHVVLDNCGHMVHIQQPSALADAICAFLDG